MKHIEIEVRATGTGSRVMVDGEDIPCRRAVITIEVGHPTMIDLECFKMDHGMIRISGHLVDDG